MASSGIRKYDLLPSRIGFKDVDAMRAAYAINFNRYVSSRDNLLKIKEKLEKVYKDYKMKGGKKRDESHNK